MEKLSISVDREMDVLCRWGLTADEWMFIKLLFVAKEPEGRPQLFMRYINECTKTGVPRDMLTSLKNKKVLDAKYNIPKEGEATSIDDIKFSVTFEKQYFKISGEAGLEMFNAYPSHLYMTDGKMLPARNITKGGYFSSDDFFFAYCKAIKHSAQTHELVMQSLRFAKDNNLIQFGIIEYLASQKWNEHIQMMKDDKVGKFSTQIDKNDLV